MCIISIFLCFALVPKLVPRTVDFHWYWYRILKFWYRDNTIQYHGIVKPCHTNKQKTVVKCTRAAFPKSIVRQSRLYWQFLQYTYAYDPFRKHSPVCLLKCKAFKKKLKAWSQFIYLKSFGLKLNIGDLGKYKPWDISFLNQTWSILEVFYCLFWVLNCTKMEDLWARRVIPAGNLSKHKGRL